MGGNFALALPVGPERSFPLPALSLLFLPLLTFDPDADMVPEVGLLQPGENRQEVEPKAPPNQASDADGC